MAASKTTINDVLGILNAVNKWAYSSHNIATVALKGLRKLPQIVPRYCTNHNVKCTQNCKLHETFALATAKTQALKVLKRLIK
jgi:hypothetical protein